MKRDARNFPALNYSGAWIAGFMTKCQSQDGWSQWGAVQMGVAITTTPTL